jgi:DNA-binding GntR family transcriptional regulator
MNIRRSHEVTGFSGFSAPTRLPSEFEMAEQYGVSRDVIRRAKEELASQGWLIVLQSRGTFVAHAEPGEGN